MAVRPCCPPPCIYHMVGIKQLAKLPTVRVRRGAKLAVPGPIVALTGGFFGSSLHGDSRRDAGHGRVCPPCWERQPVLNASRAAGSPGCLGRFQGPAPSLSGPRTAAGTRDGRSRGRRCVRRGRAVQVVVDQTLTPRGPACCLTALGVGVASRFSALAFLCILTSECSESGLELPRPKLLPRSSLRSAGSLRGQRPADSPQPVGAHFVSLSPSTSPCARCLH